MSIHPDTNHNQISLMGADATIRGPVPEILAPVGGRDQFFAALNAGADAVFLGLKQFNARSRAENFTTDDLLSLVPLAHRYGMKVNVTLNILIKDIELEDLVSTLSELEDIGVDAIIVQDLGVASIARKFFPGLRLHASTQMAVHNLAGVQKAYEWGFRRVVLARELTAVEIKRIRSAVPKEMIELEVFCHGSLCYSYSGLCFFSGAADARSGNRGECAYTCREPYKIVSEAGQGFLFSMRDLDTSHKLDLMVDAGVDTLKIEGRKKDAQYVSSVVKLYRKKLNEHFNVDTLRESAPPLAKSILGTEAEIRGDLSLSFQRQTTSFFFEGRYHENVIDLNSPTHSGTRVGVIESVSGKTMRVRLEKAIEQFDGLKVVPSHKIFHAKPQDGETLASSTDALEGRYENKELQFSARDVSQKGRKLFEAHNEMTVDINVGPEHSLQTVASGDLLFKTRSSELKRRVETLTRVPVDERLRPMRAVRAVVDARALDDGQFHVKATLLRLGEIVASQSISRPSRDIRRSGELTTDLRDGLEVFGATGFYVESFDWQVDDQAFVPRSLIKELKKSLELQLEASAQEVVESHKASALAALGVKPKALSPVLEPTFEIKIDRLDYLPTIANLIKTGSLLGLREIIFEPKKMYLETLSSDEFLGPLCDFVAVHPLKLRLAVPTVIRAWDEPVLKKWLKDAVACGVQAFEIGNPGALALLKAWEIPTTDLASDFMLYAMNRSAAEFWRNEGVKALALSIEDDWTDLESLLTHWPEGVSPTAILYKDTPLFVAESCSLTALHNGCPTSKVCGYRSLEIENTKGERFIVAHEGCKSIVYGKEAYSISGNRKMLQQAGVGRFRVDFLTRHYDEASLTSILNSVWADEAISATHAANFHGTLK